MEPFQKIQLSFKCPKALDELTPCQSNWYCDGCRKMVYDFRGFTEEQIIETFKQSGKQLCGIYETYRAKPVVTKLKTPHWVTAAMFVFGIALIHQAP